MAELFYVSNKKEALKHWFQIGLSKASLALFSPTPDLCSVLENSTILKSIDTRKSQVNAYISESLSQHNYTVPALYLNLINEIYWFLPVWTKKSEFYNLYWQADESQTFNFIEAFSITQIFEQFKQNEKNNTLKLFSQNNFFNLITSFKNDYLNINVSIDNVNNSLPVFKKGYITDNNISFNNNDISIILSFDYFISSGFNLFDKKLNIVKLDELNLYIEDFIRFCSFYKNNIKSLFIVNNPNYTPDEFIFLIEEKLIKHLLDKQIVSDVIRGPFAYSQEVILNMENLIEKTMNNIENDPRNKNKNYDGNSLPSFLNEIVPLKIKSLSSPLCYLSYKNLKDSIETKTITVRRNDYEYFIKYIDNLNLEYVKKELLELINAQENPDETITSLKYKFDILRSEIQYIRQRFAPFIKISTPKEVTKEYLQLKKKDQELQEEYFKKLDDEINNLGAMFGNKP